MIRNFLFHRVHPERDALWDPIDPTLFEKCVRYITSKYEVVLLEEYLQNPGCDKKSKYATIMFDDGYKDNITFAAPILKKYNCKASFYVVTDSIDNNIPTWTFNLDYRFRMTGQTKINLDFDFLPPHLGVKELKTEKEKFLYVRNLKPFIKNLKHEQRVQVLTAVENSFADRELPASMMNWQDLKELKTEGHYIGSHTSTHPMLGTMSDEREIKRELATSRERIHNELGYFPVSISYPIGSFNGQTKKLAEETGYTLGLAVKQKTYRPAFDCKFEIPRIEVYNESWLKTRLRLAGTIEFIKSFTPGK